MKKILLVYHALSSGEFSYAGMEKMLVWLGNSLADCGYDVTFCTLFDRERCLRYSDKAKSIELGLEYHKSFIRRNLTTFIVGTYKLNSVLEDKYDVVVNFGDTAFFLCLLLKPIYHYILITSERGDPNNSADFLERMRRKLIKFSDRVVFQTVGASQFFPNTVRLKSSIIANPIVIPEESWRLDKSARRIAFIGRIDFWQKRPDVLIKAFSIVHCKHPDYKLDVCGSGEGFERLKALVYELNLIDSVVLHGAVQNVKQIMMQDEIFVLTSDFEGIPNALLEAMAIGMPVVSTDCSPGGAALLIENGVNGILVPCADVNGVADGICKLIEDREFAKQLGTCARESVRKFTPEKIIREWCCVINKL